MPIAYSRNQNLKWTSTVNRYRFYKYQAGYKTSRGEKRKPLAYEGFSCYASLDKVTGPSAPYLYPDAWFSEVPRDLRDPTQGIAGNRSWQNAVNKGVNVARARFIEKARAASKVQIGETVAQATDMLSIIEKRTRQLARGVVLLKQRKLRAFFANFGVPTPLDKEFRPAIKRNLSQRKLKTPPTWGKGSSRWGEPSPRNRWEDRSRYVAASGRLKAKDVASVWLEYWFVWAPSVADCYGAMEILCDSSPVHGQRVTASSTRKLDYKQVYPWSGDLFRTTYGGDFKTTTRIRARVNCLNPNRQLYDIMGLSNPLLILWWSLPLSFLADWVVNVGEILESYQDTIDWILNDSEIVTYNRCLKGYANYVSTYPASTSSEYYSFTAGYMKRQVGVGLPGVRFIIEIPRLSLTRALTASSLLASQLRSI